MSETRKIAAILAADVVGFSRLTGADEDRTLARPRALRSDLTDPTIVVHNGRVVKRTGDGLIAEFRAWSTPCAARSKCSTAWPGATQASRDNRIQFRIGVHLGDVVEEADGDLTGDGVNIAARLEGIAAPGGLCLSSAAYEQVRDKVKEPFSDLGERELSPRSTSAPARWVRSRRRPQPRRRG
jgi:adenylate cyclase